MKLLLDEALPASIHAWVGRRVEGRPAARALYDEVRRGEQSASHKPLSGPQLARIQRNVASRVERERASAADRGAAAWLLPMVTGAGLATAAAVLVVMLGPSSEPDLQPRGRTDGALGLQVRCLEKGEGAKWRIIDAAVATPQRPASTLRCAPHSVLAWSGTNLQERPRHVFVIGVTDADELRWYPPFEPEDSSLELGAGTVGELVETLADLSSLDAAKNTSLFVLFADRPLKGRDIEDALQAARRRGQVRLGALDRLPLHVEEQSRVDLRLEAP